MKRGVWCDERVSGTLAAAVDGVAGRMSEEGQGAASHTKQAAAEGAALPPPDGAALHDASTAVSQNNLNQVPSSTFYTFNAIDDSIVILSLSKLNF